MQMFDEMDVSRTSILKDLMPSHIQAILDSKEL
jgi:hypothetical protein